MPAAFVFVPERTCRVFSPVDSGSRVEVDSVEEKAVEEGSGTFKTHHHVGPIDPLDANNGVLLAWSTLRGSLTVEHLSLCADLHLEVIVNLNSLTEYF